MPCFHPARRGRIVKWRLSRWIAFAFNLICISFLGSTSSLRPVLVSASVRIKLDFKDIGSRITIELNATAIWGTLLFSLFFFFSQNLHRGNCTQATHWAECTSFESAWFMRPRRPCNRYAQCVVLIKPKIIAPLPSNETGLTDFSLKLSRFFHFVGSPPKWNSSEYFG